jgi:hypothetical protein
MIPMARALTIAAFFALILTTVAFANPDHGKATSATQARAVKTIVIRQDLFDRNNPNNLRSNWPSPPAQPGQF